MYILVVVLLIVASVGLIGVVLLQSGRGDGLSGAFGMGEGQAVFGSRAGDVLTKATSWFAIAFAVLCIAVVWQSKHAGDSIMTGRRSAGTGRGRVAPLMTLEQSSRRDSSTAASTNSDSAAAAGVESAPAASPN